jgi:hypothetical protein
VRQFGINTSKRILFCLTLFKGVDHAFALDLKFGTWKPQNINTPQGFQQNGVVLRESSQQKRNQLDDAGRVAPHPWPRAR